MNIQTVKTAMRKTQGTETS